MDPRVGDDHFAAHFAQYPCANPKYDRVFIHQHGKNIAHEHYKGDRKHKAKQQQEQVAVAGGTNGQHVVDAHAHVSHNDDPNGLPDAASLMILALLIGTFAEQFDGNPDDHGPPRQV